MEDRKSASTAFLQEFFIEKQLTATATHQVKTEIMETLGIEGCKVLQQGFNRKNLYYEIRSKGSNNEESLGNLLELVRSYEGECGIIYCWTKKNCEIIAGHLKIHGISAKHYHADLRKKDRINIQKEWQSGIIHVVVATTAFGMDTSQKDRKISNLLAMKNYCENIEECRKKQILRYFGDEFSLSKCDNCCDNCHDHKEIKILDDRFEISKQPSDKSNKRHNEEQWCEFELQIKKIKETHKKELILKEIDDDPRIKTIRS
nr:10902_t:CDS:2 [Entrophospora candida]